MKKVMSFQKQSTELTIKLEFIRAKLKIKEIKFRVLKRIVVSYKRFLALQNRNVKLQTYEFRKPNFYDKKVRILSL